MTFDIAYLVESLEDESRYPGPNFRGVFENRITAPTVVLDEPPVFGGDFRERLTQFLAAVPEPENVDYDAALKMFIDERCNFADRKPIAPAAVLTRPVRPVQPVTTLPDLLIDPALHFDLLSYLPDEYILSIEYSETVPQPSSLTTVIERPQPVPSPEEFLAAALRRDGAVMTDAYGPETTIGGPNIADVAPETLADLMRADSSPDELTAGIADDQPDVDDPTVVDGPALTTSSLPANLVLFDEQGDGAELFDLSDVPGSDPHPLISPQLPWLRMASKKSSNRAA